MAHEKLASDIKRLKLSGFWMALTGWSLAALSAYHAWGWFALGIAVGVPLAAAGILITGAAIKAGLDLDSLGLID